MNQRFACSVVAGCLCGAWALGASAHALTVAECAEGGEFIRNAALARDHGISREFFMGKLEEDLALIQAFPPQLRWFVQDSGDEKLLTDAVSGVFDKPEKAEQHESRFISACLEAATAMGEAAASQNRDDSI